MLISNRFLPSVMRLPASLRFCAPKARQTWPKRLAAALCGFFLATCLTMPMPSFAAAGQSSVDILGAAGKGNMNAAYKKYFDAKGNGQGGSLYHFISDGSAFIASDYDSRAPDGYYAVLTEGMSYGMVVTLQMNDEYKFQRLWDFVRKYMSHNNPSDSLYGYHSWKMKTNGSDVQVVDSNVATDGEIWFAAALLMASGRWGDKAYPYDYKARAQDILDALKGDGAYAKTPQESRIFIQQASDSRYAMVRFGPYVNWSDPSYHVPAFTQLFAKSARSTQQYFWSDVTAKSRAYLSRTTFKSVMDNGSTLTNAATGLFPNQAGFDGVSDSSHSFSESDRQFGYDAWRTLSNIGLDFTLWGKSDNPYMGSEQAAVNKLLSFFKNQNYGRNAYLYALDGSPVQNGTSAGLVGANATGATATNSSTLKNGFANAFNGAQIPDDYYGSCLYMLNSIMANGDFVMYVP